MNFIPEYILKLSISIAGVFVFYYLVLRRLTFYNYNRWYLLGYTVLCFFIPFINVSAVLQKNNWQQNGIVSWVPAISSDAVPELPVTNQGSWGLWQWAVAIAVAGMLVMICRLMIQLFSFKKMLQQAEPVSNAGMNLYQVNDNIMPFSFGNSIFINRHLHAEHELEEIIRHEFVHVKQKHSLDIIWAELLCIINWYNPFVWLLKRSIRQNLEFIADHKVLENGINKKEYQYLLLKVIGNNQYSIANQFNFSSLKKRIAMMNKTKSAKRQLIRLLFLLPATAVLLLAFRGKWNAAANTAFSNSKQVNIAGHAAGATTLQPIRKQNMPGNEEKLDVVEVSRDTTKKNKPNSKGYIINVKNINGEDIVVIKDKAGKEIKSIPVKEWDENEEKYEKIYGEATATPPATPAVAVITETVSPVIEPTVVGVISPASANVITTNISPAKITTVTTSSVKVATVISPSVKIATVTSPVKVTVVSSPVKVATTVKPVIAISPETVVEVAATPAVVSVPVTTSVIAQLPDNVKKVQVDNNKVTLWLKNGKKENFDLNNAEEKKELEKKYSIYAPSKPVPPVEVPAKEN